ncbi:MAG: arabinofuranosidase catalytic domain-containing protein [Pseudomonadota bacterium]
MKTRSKHPFGPVPLLVGVFVGMVTALGCGSSSGDKGGSGGVATGSGGGPASGGRSGTGGGPPGTGGLANSGGATASGGAASASGGATGSGGVANSGGSPGSGGRTGPGGSTGAAGRASGGTPGQGGAAGQASTGGSGAGAGGSSGGTRSGAGVCDLFASGSTPCVAAHSTVRALYGAYTGNLYQVTRASDKTTKDIGVLSPGGFADSAAQDTFCTGTSCTISIIYDQSGKNNHLTQAPPGQRKATADTLADAAALKFTISGHTVYGVHLPPGYGYRNDKTTGVATGDQPETEYMVTSGTYFNGNCCWDYGNAETNNTDDGAGTMEAVYFGNYTHQGKGGGTGPWVMADMENGVFAGPSFAANPMVTPLTSAYVTAMVIGRAGSFALRGGNAQMGTVTTMYDGVRANGYNPMKKQGAIILGIGGDNTAGGQGNFYEGVLTSGAASEATTDAVQANIVAAGYGK